MNTLYTLRGLPGSGKTTLAKELAELFQKAGNTVLCVAADDFYTNGFDPNELKSAHNLCQVKVSAAMTGATDVIIVHNTFTQEWELEPYLKMADTWGYRHVSLIVENRHGNRSVHAVPPKTLKKMRDRFETELIPDDHLKGGILGYLDFEKKFFEDIVFAMEAVPQREDYHPEGNVLRHTALVCAQLTNKAPELFWAGLFHDLGKYNTLAKHPKKGHYTTYGHAKESVRIFREHAPRLLLNCDLDRIEFIVANHMRKSPEELAKVNTSPYYRDLLTFNRADDMLRLQRQYGRQEFEGMTDVITEAFVEWIDNGMDDSWRDNFNSIGNLVPSGRTDEEIKADFKAYFDAQD